MADEKQKTKEDIIRELTEDSLRRGFVPFPKWLYHPDGRSQLVANELEQTALGGEWLASPQEAIDEKAKRDKRDSDAFIAKANAEAAAKLADDAENDDEESEAETEQPRRGGKKSK